MKNIEQGNSFGIIIIKKRKRITKHQKSTCWWEEHKSSTDRVYYYNVITDHSQSKKPSRKQLSASSSYANKSINKNHIHSKRVRILQCFIKYFHIYSLNNDDHRLANNQYYSKQKNPFDLNHILFQILMIVSIQLVRKQIIPTVNRIFTNDNSIKTI
ncbi:unnamed protein product [Rotaria socialis]|uniref:WW domain-containing protein n=1 Tax=Rotaria socialis TaxID=392032 RepID=A0A820X3V1_9BILA|nr:unnamed protein product [Rotaria socialis]